MRVSRGQSRHTGGGWLRTWVTFVVGHDVRVLPELVYGRDDGRAEAGHDLPMLVWREKNPARVISSAPLGGGLGIRHWIVNATVSMDYARFDPDAHLQELAGGIGLSGPGVGLLTGVDVSERTVATDGDVTAVATVGIGSPAWAAAPDGHLRREPRVGTINIVVHVPVLLSDAALVNAVVTATEAKAQALWSLKIDATGTASDAVCIVCPAGGHAESFGGPRSTWGARIARAVYSATHSGGVAWRNGGRAWSDRR